MRFERCRTLLRCCCAALALAGMQALAESVSVGTRLEIRLQQPISSYATQKGTRISGVLIAPLTEGGDMLLPLGTTVEGSVIEVRKVGIGVVHETARLRDLMTIETRVRAYLPRGVLSPPDLRNAALQRVPFAPAVLGSVELHRVVHVAPVWRPLLTDLGRQVRLTWRNPGDPDAAWFAGELGSDQQPIG